jgi:hypothetical protein
MLYMERDDGFYILPRGGGRQSMTFIPSPATTLAPAGAHWDRCAARPSAEVASRARGAASNATWAAARFATRPGAGSNWHAQRLLRLFARRATCEPGATRHARASPHRGAAARRVEMRARLASRGTPRTPKRTRESAQPRPISGLKRATPITTRATGLGTDPIYCVRRLGGWAGDTPPPPGPRGRIISR